MPYLPADLTNAAATTVDTDLAADDTELDVATGGGAVLLAYANVPFLALVGAASGQPEVVEVTAIDVDALTITRGVNAVVSGWSAGTTVQVARRVSEDALYAAVSQALSAGNIGGALNGGAGGTPVLKGNTAVATGAAGTIATAGIAVSKVNPAADRTGCILAAGTADGQTVTVVNKSAHSVTFDVSGTSFVADGSSDVIATLTAATYVWESVSALWYRAV